MLVSRFPGLPPICLLLLLAVATGAARCGDGGAEGGAGETADGPGPSAPSLSPGQVAPAPAHFAWRGMTFAHEGYDGVRGYGGAATDASLDSLARLGVDAIAVVPYTFMPAPDAPGPLPIPTQRGAETDASVVATVHQAHARGWRVLLKPQIWIRGAWPGEVDFASDAAWDAWLGHYRTWILHYARLAAEHDVEALCIGTELTRATLEHPAFWRKLISEVRAVYPGSVTYAANWGEEFEGIAFWGELDALGLNGYYPLSRKPDPTDAELLAGARAWVAMAEGTSRRAGRPWWLTEVGYRSVEGAWTNPHAAPEGRPADAAAQARCYAALLTAAAEAQRLEGIFFWKWPSYLGWGREDQSGAPAHWRTDPAKEFHPSAPATADVVRAFYGSAPEQTAAPTE